MNTVLRSFILLVAIGSTYLANAQAQFPLLTGRVVDNANLLSVPARAQISQVLAQHEEETSNQLVVVTLPNLNGYDIADYAYQLGRHWRIGQAGKDNGVLLIIAKQERKVRIDVGYGLEGALTDALSHQIINNDITPRFKQGQFEQGINAGVQSILQAIKGEYQAASSKQHGNESIFDKVIPFIMFGAAGSHLLFARLLGFRRKKRDVQTKVMAAGGTGVLVGLIGGIVLSSLQLGLIAGVGAALLALLFFNDKGGHGGGFYPYGPDGRPRGGGRGGGFSGGGGSFGGGGASGSW